uniref:Putative DNA ligase domain protein n=4 Tax=viral metagenome TaxID=1070528 RepID=A0A6M3K9M5_9ZZZZ
MTSNFQRWKGIMKAYPFEEKRLAKWTPPYIVQPKFDGVRCRSLPIQTGPTGNETLLLSSEENIIYSVPHINQILQGITAELDGELYCHGMSFEDILSITSRTVNIHSDHRKIQFYVFDIVNKEPQMRRSIIIEKLRGMSPWLVVAPFWVCESLDEVIKTYDDLISMGYEGIIVRHNNAPYVKKRSTFMMKFKPKKEDIYEIVGFVEEESIHGVPKCSLGSFVCNSGDGNTFNVGTGFTADQRHYYWNHREEVVGKSVRVKYQYLIPKSKKPRHSVFVEVIEDGNST